MHMSHTARAYRLEVALVGQLELPLRERARGEERGRKKEREERMRERGERRKGGREEERRREKSHRVRRRNEDKDGAQEHKQPSWAAIAWMEGIKA